MPAGGPFAVVTNRNKTGASRTCSPRQAATRGEQEAETAHIGVRNGPNRNVTEAAT